MKTLTKIKLINWHYFWNETIDIKPIVFLTGLNGSGKSTLIDAFEVVLLGDTTGRSFNKAALEKSSRTLQGYLRGELGDNIEGGYKYLRNGRFTSYIALEFHDDLLNNDFVMGIVFDCYEDGSEEHHFFTLDDKIPQNEFIFNNVPFSYKELAGYLASYYKDKYQFFDTNKKYQEYLKKKLGGLKDKYFSLLKKATSFTPITDITSFITDYVCDPQKDLDLTHLSDNITQYKKLQDESESLKRRIDRLEEIKASYDVYKAQEKEFNINKYLIEKCELYNNEEKLKAFKNEVVDSKKRISEIENELIEFNDNLKELEKRKVKIIQDKMNNDVAKITDDLYNQKKDINKKINEINEELLKSKEELLNYANSYLKESSKLLIDLNNVNKDALDEDKEEEILQILSSSTKCVEICKDIKEKLESSLTKINKEDLNNFKNILKDFKDNVSVLAVSLARTMKNIQNKISSLKEEVNSIKSGSKPIDTRILAIKSRLKEELKFKYKKDIEVELYCDLINIKDMEWSNAIEGYLMAQKFNIFVAPKYYLDAYSILKDLLEEYRLYSLSLVDSEKLIEKGYEALTNSLASEIVTSHEGARAYTNFLIGRLIKCDDIEGARESANGITRNCDLYRNYSLSKINPRYYQTSFIGESLDNRFLNEKNNQIKLNEENLITYKNIYSLIVEATSLEVLSTGEIEHLIKSFIRSNEIKGLNDTLSYVENELKEHDTTLLQSLDKRLNDVEDDIKETNESKERVILEKGNLIKEIESLELDKIKEVESLIKERKENLTKNYEESLIKDVAEPLFNEKINNGESHLDILQNANSSLTRLQYLYNNSFSSLIHLRRDYVHDYHLSYNPDVKDNDTFNNELIEFKEVRLPEYNEKIHDAYLKATQQFKDDFIYKLRGAIGEVEDQIDNLNDALSQSSFGRDSYRFTVSPSIVFKRYYDMLKDDSILDSGEDESVFLNKYQDVMEDLFKQIVDVNNDSTNSELLNNIERFTDYRSYLDFDLIVYNKDTKEEQRLSKMIKKKSGGETQTPFYIAVLASFAQLYHVNDEGNISNTSRIIIFDEAFSKMDRGRIKEAVKLLRKFNLQVIISCPTDKVADISELVDETLVVLHNKNSSSVRKFSKL